MKTRTKSQQSRPQKSLEDKQKQVKKQKTKKANDKKINKQNKSKRQKIKMNNRKIKYQKYNKKIKKKPSPKKHLKKSYERIKKQRLYLMNISNRIVTAQQNPKFTNRWIFMVKGMSGNYINHSIVFSTQQVNCTCKSFQIKKNTCVHVEFIMTQVIKNIKILDQIKNIVKLTQESYNILDEMFLNRLKTRINHQSYIKIQKQQKIEIKHVKQQQINNQIYTDCQICFTQMDNLIETLQQCPTCNKQFHYDCLTIWKKRNDTCPLCSGNLKNLKDNIIDSLNSVNIQLTENNNKQ